MTLSMDKVKKYVQKITPKLIYDMNLTDWDITFQIMEEHSVTGEFPIEDNTLGDTSCKPKYKEATIRIFLKGHNTLEYLLTTIKHELGHVLSAGFDNILKEDIIMRKLSEDESKLYCHLLSILEEDFAVRVQRMKFRSLND